MNNLYRELAPISQAAWDDIEAEAKRTFTEYLAGRRVVDVDGPSGVESSAVGTGHVTALSSPFAGVQARGRVVLPLVELRAPFSLSRQEIDSVERGAQDADWQPVKDAAKQIAYAEDRTIFEGYADAGIQGIRQSVTSEPLLLPPDARDYPDVITAALNRLRLSGVNGPYRLVMGVQAYTAVHETADHGYPIQAHLARILDGDIIWAPAIDGAFLLSGRGGDFTLHLGQDLSIGYLSHDNDTVKLYFQESLTFTAYTAEAAVALSDNA